MIVVVIRMTILVTVTTVVMVMKELKMRMEVMVVMVVMSMMNMVQQDSCRGEICLCLVFPLESKLSARQMMDYISSNQLE